MFSTAEALLCGEYTPLGQVQIGPLSSLSGQLSAYQIPDAIISTLKLADLSVTAAKLGISSVSDSKVAAGAGILESKLSLDYSTDSLNTLINILDTEYGAHDHSVADPTQVDHASLSNVLTSQHHAKTTTLAELTDHNKANHDALGLSHDSLVDVSTSDHHVRYADSEAKDACVRFATMQAKIGLVGCDQVDAGAADLTLARYQLGSAVDTANFSFKVPKNCPTGNWYLKITYFTAAGAETVGIAFNYSVSAYKAGDAYTGWNIANNQSLGTLATSSAYTRFEFTKSLGATIDPDDVVVVSIKKTAVNTYYYHIVGVALYWE